MKIGLLLPTNVYFCPYVKIYTDILDGQNIPYDILCYDKRGLEEGAAHRFTRLIDEAKAGSRQRLINYYRYSRFLARTIKRERYDRLIVFGPQVAIFLTHFLCKHYAGRFILDYRDLSIEQHLMMPYKKLMQRCAHHVISSPAFATCLPDVKQHIISHNFDIAQLRKALSDVRTEPYQLADETSTISVLTIGGIRDYEQNRDIMAALTNCDGFSTAYVGRGIALEPLKRYAEEHHIGNATFVDYYEKRDEPTYIEAATMLNIYYPRRLSHNTALSNRFYNSIIFRRPMITTADTLQGNYARDYGLGVAINDTNDLPARLRSYFSTFDWQQYEHNRHTLLTRFLDDYTRFEAMLTAFVHE